MISSINFPDGDDNDHLRNLLDQRAARADIQSHCPSVSEFSDTPSVYSRSFFSPRPHDNNSQLNTPYGRDSFPASPRSPLTDRERLNDPTASSLDFGDDPRSSFCSTDSYDVEGESTLPDEEDDVSSTSRMSVLGPKMRFHSLAPWEIETESVLEEEESENGHGGYMSSAFGGMFSPGISTVAGGLKKGFGFVSSNPKPSTSRPSADSVRTQHRPKGSFESTSSQESISLGARLKEASRSSTLVSSLPYAQSNLKSKLSAAFGAPEALRSENSLVSLGRRRGRSPSTILTNIDTNSSRPSSPSSSTCQEDDIHPYANPDLVLAYTNNPPRSPMWLSQPASVPRSESNATVTNTPAPTGFFRHSPEPSIGSEPRTPVSVSFHSETSSSKSLSGSPIRQETIRSSFESSPYSGWAGNTEAPNFTLISLEEARALRARGTTNHSVSSTSGFTFTESDARESPVSPVGSTSHGRTRSISAGTKAAKSGFTSLVGGGGPAPRFERRGSEPAVVRGVKQKKSGFLRIFNGREKDKSIPPVPPIANSYACNNAFAHASSASLPQPPAISLATTPPSMRKARRIPVPPLLPVDPVSGSSSTSEPGSGDSSPLPSLSAKRLQPGLSINTSSSPSPSSKAPSPPRSATRPTNKAWSHLAPVPPQSAPANVTTFPALQLRPVSTMFSSQFGDHIVRTSLESTAEVDSDSNSIISPSLALTPLTPGFAHRIEERPKGMICSSDDVNSAIVQALQEEITHAKQAWQMQIRELEGQVRDLKSELDEIRSVEKDTPHCDSCGRGKPKISINGSSVSEHDHETKQAGVVNRPRVRTGSAARFGTRN